MVRRFNAGLTAVLAVVCLACSRGTGAGAGGAASPVPELEAPVRRIDPVPLEPAREAFLSGWMPLASTGVPRFDERHPEYDGRGVIIAILDSGLDTDVAGFRATSTGDAKVLDLRDFSREGRVPLDPVIPTGKEVTIGSHSLSGFGRVVSHSVSQEYYAGRLAEIPLGTPLVIDPEAPPPSDLNGNGRYSDTLAVVVTRAQNGWVLFADTDGDGSLGDERPIHDYLESGRTFGWTASPDSRSPLAVAANFSDSAGRPVLDLMFDTSGHGTHVAGIASGHDMYDVEGFDGVAPGAYLLGLKISNNARGGISVDGSIVRAMAYAVDFAARRRMPLVINLSFGVGNELEGTAVIDRLVDSLLAEHPDAVMTVSAGNHGPGLSTMGFPASAGRPVTVGATFPLVFLARPVNGPVLQEPLAFFSSRGGELAKPDLVAPGVAYSTVPGWNTGNERNAGTSMAAPHVAGLAARLLTAARATGLDLSSADLKHALMVTAVPLSSNSFVDQGAGLPDIDSAWRWLERNAAAAGVTGAPAASVAGWTVLDDSPGTSGQNIPVPVEDPLGPLTLETPAGWVERPSVKRVGDVAALAFDARRDSIVPGTASTAVISGWPVERSGGPAFRLVQTVVRPLAAGVPADVGPVRLPAGGTRRLFFQAQEGRPFHVRVETGGVFERMFTSLHQPGGAPWLGGNGVQAGPGDDAAVYRVDGRDVRSGIYQIAAVASPVEAGTVRIRLRHSPFRVAARVTGGDVWVTLANVSEAPQETTTRVSLLGGVRRVTIRGTGGEESRVEFSLPAWARLMELDAFVSPHDWGRFTDYGVTVLDGVGRLVADGPLEHATGRIHQVLGPAHADLPVVLSLMPGLADTSDTGPWSATVEIRLYAGSAVPLEASGDGGGAVSLAPGASDPVAFRARPSPWPLEAGFAPLGIVMTETEGLTWTREVTLAPPDTP